MLSLHPLSPRWGANEGKKSSLRKLKGLKDAASGSPIPMYRDDRARETKKATIGFLEDLNTMKSLILAQDER